MVSPRYFVSSTLEDPKDALQMAIDPKSTMMQAKMSAFNRTTDDLLIAAMGGTAYTGQNGATPVTFTAGNKITYNQFSSGNGLTKAKVLRASRLLNSYEVETNDRFLVHTAAQVEDLLNTTEVTSSDYNVIKALYMAELNTWCGFNFIRSERLVTDSTPSRLLYAFHRAAVQLYARMCMGATRLEENRIIQIACYES
jgi:hypothetical protein